MIFVYDRAEEPLPIPYTSALENGRTDVGFIDTKRYPSRLGEIHEASEFPELRNLIRTLSSRKSFFRTLSCEMRYSPSDHSAFRKKAVSWLDICFEIAVFNLSDQPYAELAMDCRRSCSAFRLGEFDGTAVHFIVCPTTYNELPANGYRLRIWSLGYGNSNKQAYRNWRLAFSRVSRLLLMASGLNTDLLAKLLTFLDLNEGTQKGWTDADHELMREIGLEPPMHPPE